MADLIEDATRELYSVSPDDFMQRRGELVDAARTTGDSAAAQQIGKLRKPTAGAWLVNSLVLEDPAIVDRLTELGDRLRAAQDALDAAKLRDLSNERRKLVDELTGKAFRNAQRTDPPAALRDEVTGTFDAAIADAEVAARLGRLQRAEQWSGFGFLPTASPQLSVVRGAKDEKRKVLPKVSAAEKRKLQRALAAAQKQFDTASAAFEDAQVSERALDQELRRLTKQLGKIQQRVDEARTELEQARKDVTAARAKRREARSALDKAEREADV
ncbi:MAG TPA: hypothetical protein VE442_16835 [Jatrophihabitans sp.]|nr:hypothetical protein [Jatrophihabitans sp.]